MYLKKMEVKGFKSFAEHINIEFHDGITCIVGPNGSGKSNISDALKWVLGEQSPKTLRGSKMEDVIFAGTHTRKSRGMAEVTLTIDNTTNILPVDYSEVAITRRLYRSGDSEYLINSNPCRLKDIREMLMDTGMGVDGYSNIGQGQIMDIINSKPDDRRKIFEEVAGIVKFRTKKGEAEKKLEATHQNLLRVQDIINELEGRIEPLKIESEKAKEYLELKSKIKKIEINLAIKSIDSIEENIQSFKNELEALVQEIKMIHSEKDELDDHSNLYGEMREKIEYKSMEIQDRIIFLIQEINAIENQKTVNKEKIIGLDKDENRLKEDILVLEEKVSEQEKNIKNYRDKESDIENRYLALKEQQESITAQFELKNSQLKDQSLDIENKKSKIIEVKNLIVEKRAEIKSMENLESSLFKRKEQILLEYQEIKASNKGVLNEQTLLLTKKKKVEEYSNELEESIELVKDRIRLLKLDEKKLALSVNDNRIKFNEAETKYKLLKEMEDSYEGFNMAVKSLMKSPIIDETIHGAVADLIDVPKGYERAIETALGQGLQNIVCDDNKSAKKAIDYMKKNNLGRATFLPIKNITSYINARNNDIKKERGFVGYAVDCVEADSQYSEIIEYLLGRVIIIDTLDNALYIGKGSYKGYRIVTLDGDIINSSGAITGGSFRENKSSILTRKGELKDLETRIRTLKGEYKKSKDSLEAKQSDIVKSDKSLESLEAQHKEKQNEFFQLDKEILRIVTDIRSFKESEERWKKEVSDIEKEEVRAKGMIEILEADVEKYDYELINLEKETNEKLDEYEGERIAVEQLHEDMTDMKLKFATVENDRANLKDAIKRTQDYLNEIEKDKRRNTENILAIHENKNQIIEKNKELEVNLEAKEKGKELLEEEKAKNVLEKENLLKEIGEASKMKTELDRKVFDYQQTKHDIEVKIAKGEMQIETLKDKLWNEFEVSYIEAIEYKKETIKYTNVEAKNIRQRLKEIGEVNVKSIEEYDSVKERYEFLTEQKEDLSGAIKSLDKVIEDMDKAIKTNFANTFKRVAENFQKVFTDLFGGGIAHLKMDNEENILETGIEIIAQPPGKKLQNITLMSGGEKTLTAIALMFAILKVKPTPFCIMDEVEAALDDANIIRFANYLKTFEDIQFILVTHQKATMEFADVLYGVTMAEQGISKVISLKLA
ncbi:MAG: chromosome segregation protein SMC [Peptostreptococcales bacterium]